MRLLSFTIGLYLLMVGSSLAQSNKWQIDVDAQLLFSDYNVDDTGHGFKPRFSVPDGTGSLSISYALNTRGLFVESALGYRPIMQAYAYRNSPSNSSGGTNGIELWYVPLLFRVDVMSLLFPNWGSFSKWTKNYAKLFGQSGNR